MASVAQEEKVGNCYFQKEFKAWIQKRKSNAIINPEFEIYFVLRTLTKFIQRKGAVSMEAEHGYHTERQIRALGGQEEITETWNYR